MKIYEIDKSLIYEIPVQIRYNYLIFIMNWFNGYYMTKNKRQKNIIALEKWKEISKIFPPKLSDMILYRLITVPIKYADKKSFIIKPAISLVSSWTENIHELENINDTAREVMNINENDARIAIKSTIPGKLILATVKTIREAFINLSYDFDSVHEKVLGDSLELMRQRISYFRNMKHGGYLNQHEFIIETTQRMRVENISVFRRGKTFH